MLDLSNFVSSDKDNYVCMLPFATTDVAGFIPANTEQFNFFLSIPNFFQNLSNYCEGNAFCIYKNNNILAITGWITDYLNKGADMFFIPSVALKKEFDKNVLKVFRKIVHFVKNSHIRVEADCENNPTFIRFLEFLGFEKEGRLRLASYKNEDLIVYSLINEKLKEEKCQTSYT